MKKIRIIIIVIIALAIALGGLRLLSRLAFDSLFVTTHWDITEINSEQRTAVLEYTELSDFDYIKVDSVSAVSAWSLNDSFIEIIISVDKSHAEKFTPIAEKAGYTILSDSADGVQSYRFFAARIGYETIRSIVGKSPQS